MSTTRIRQRVRAPRMKVYDAIVDPTAVAVWMVPDGMTSQVHAFDVRPGGGFRITLTYDAKDGAGKSGAHSDTYHGRFVELVPGQRVVQTMEFETEDPQMQGEMKTTFELVEADGNTEVVGTHQDVPPGVKPSDNELGWRMALGKLAAWVEAR